MYGDDAGHESHRANGHTHGPTPIALAGMEYAAHGWPLVLLPPRSKRAVDDAWNRRDNAVTDPAVIARHRGNIGLALAWPRVVSIDVDDVQAAHEWLETRGVNLMQLLCAPDAVRIESGAPNRTKLFYALRAGANASDYITRYIKDDAKNNILELRCAAKDGKTVQDVLPPSIHPITKQPYRWRGDWRHLPELPDELQRLWHSLPTASRNGAQGARDDTRGDGNGADFLAVVAKLDALGCKPHGRGGDVRAHCPVHFGESGTTLHVNEKPDGTVLVFCHAGCTQDAVMDALGWGPGPEVRMGIGPRAEAQERTPEADAPEPAPDALPPLTDALNALPGRLGEVQRWVLDLMKHPHEGAAGLVALMQVNHLAMAHTRVVVGRGLGMGEFYLVLAPTAFGKELLRLPSRSLVEFCAREHIPLPDLRYSAPSSMQGLQEVLLASNCAAMLPDEFGDYLAKAAKEPYRADAIAHMMQVYGNPFGTVDVPATKALKMDSVTNPRLSMLSTSTGERMIEVLDSSLAQRGFLNRFVMLPIASNEIGPAGDIFDASKDYTIPPALCALARDIAEAQKLVTFDGDTMAYVNAHYRAAISKLESADELLAGRINEQALRMAACFALSDGRQIINVRDMGRAYEIREGLYHRTKAFFADAGNLDDEHPTVKALNQLRKAFTRKRVIYRCHLPNHSRAYRKELDVKGRDVVVRALVAEGVVKLNGTKLESLILVDVVDSL